MRKLLSMLDLFRKGSALANPVAWKTGQITATALAGVLVAIVNVAASFGYPIPIDIETANALAAGVIAGVNVLLVVATSSKLGVSDSSKSEPPKLVNTGGNGPVDESITPLDYPNI